MSRIQNASFISFFLVLGCIGLVTGTGVLAKEATSTFLNKHRVAAKNLMGSKQSQKLKKGYSKGEVDRIAADLNNKVNNAQ